MPPPLPSQKQRSADEDVEYIRRTLNGESSAFGNLVQKYKEPLLELASRILNSRTEAEDALQDAFIEAYRHLSDFRHQARFSTWLYAIVLNRIRNRLRQGRAFRWYSLDVRRAVRDGYRPPEPPERGQAVDQMTEEKIELEAIEKAVAGFPSRYRSIFVLHYFKNAPLEEVAQELGHPLGTVKVYLHRARKLLYKQLQAKAKFPRRSLLIRETPEEALIPISRTPRLGKQAA
jgi:RNA polymerase sigma-70 factor, ECF subfamily